LPEIKVNILSTLETLQMAGSNKGCAPNGLAVRMILPAWFDHLAKGILFFREAFCLAADQLSSC